MTLQTNDPAKPDAAPGEPALFHFSDLLWSIVLVGMLVLAGNLAVLSISHAAKGAQTRSPASQTLPAPPP